MCIKAIKEKLKMLLDRFIMNSDFDGQKEADSLDIQFTIPSFTLPAQIPYKYSDFDAPQGSFFANCVINDTVFDGINFVGSSVGFEKDNVHYNVSVYRLNDTKYRIWVAHSRVSGSTATVPTHTVRARLKFYTATKD